MIAALGASVAKTNEEFVWRHGLTNLNIRSNAGVCHIPSGLNRRPDVGELAIALFCTKRFTETTEIFVLKLASQPYHQRSSRQRRKILQERSVHAHLFVKQILALKKNFNAI